ncbi:hypothetical protein ACSXAG_03845 [Clostridium perfringens]
MYNFLIAGHTKYGLKKDTLCKSVLKWRLLLLLKLVQFAIYQ